jgi:hypothetical protein
VAKRLDQSTVYVWAPRWKEDRFDDDDAQLFWAMLPPELQAIAIAELALGNQPKSILHNEARNIVLLAFESIPQTKSPVTDSIRIHLRHENGNYCYDGTLCTYEHLVSGCFLAFSDLNYEEEQWRENT